MVWNRTTEFLFVLLLTLSVSVSPAFAQDPAGQIQPQTEQQAKQNAQQQSNQEQAQSSEDLLDDSGLLEDDSLLGDEDSLLSDDDSLLGDDDSLLDEDDSLLGDDSLLEVEDSLLEVDDSLLGGDLDSEALFGSEEDSAADAMQLTAAQEHAKLFSESAYPSAATCATCHPRHYKEWSVSQHAYAQLSPIMLSMQNAVNDYTASTNGDFCLRCHAPVGSELQEPVTMSNLDRHPASREGITCVGCHRVNRNFGKVNGRILLEPGDIYAPVYGPSGNAELQRVLENPQEFRVSGSADQPGRGIHGEAERFFELTTPGFCGSCHDVTAPTGFRLEEAFSEFKNTPAAKRGTTCQDCHMSVEQGRDAGYAHGPAAVVGKVETQARKLTNHFFAGPDYSIIHPGIFPHNVQAAQFKTLAEWLEFDWKAGWGTDEFEADVIDDSVFPASWRSVDDRYDGRAIVEEQLKALEWAKSKRLEVLRNAFDLGPIEIHQADGDGIAFSIDVKNITDGHGVPTGFDAERLFFLEVTVRDESGAIVYQSGDRDPNGDVRDWHSRYVRNGELPVDESLFNIQSKFMMRLFRGGEREQVLPVPVSLSALPFIRPEARSSILYGQARGARKHRKGIQALEARTASYRVDGDLLNDSRRYSITARFISQAVPVNLITNIMHVGFDYNMTPREVADAIVEGAVVVREKETEVSIGL